MKKTISILFALLTAFFTGCDGRRTPATYSEAIRLRDIMAAECGVPAEKLKAKDINFEHSGNLVISSTSFRVSKSSCREKIEYLPKLFSPAVMKWRKSNEFLSFGFNASGGETHSSAAAYFGDHDSVAFVDVIVVEDKEDLFLDFSVKVLAN